MRELRSRNSSSSLLGSAAWRLCCAVVRVSAFLWHCVALLWAKLVPVFARFASSLFSALRSGVLSHWSGFSPQSKDRDPVDLRIRWNVASAVETVTEFYECRDLVSNVFHGFGDPSQEECLLHANALEQQEQDQSEYGYPCSAPALPEKVPKSEQEEDDPAHESGGKEWERENNEHGPAHDEHGPAHDEHEQGQNFLNEERLLDYLAAIGSLRAHESGASNENKVVVTKTEAPRLNHACNDGGVQTNEDKEALGDVSGDEDCKLPEQEPPSLASGNDGAVAYNDDGKRAEEQHQQPHETEMPSQEPTNHGDAHKPNEENTVETLLCTDDDSAVYPGSATDENENEPTNENENEPESEPEPEPEAEAEPVSDLAKNEECEEIPQEEKKCENVGVVEGEEEGKNEYDECYDDEDDEEHELFIQRLRSEIRRLKGPNLSVIPEESESDLAESSCDGEMVETQRVRVDPPVARKVESAPPPEEPLEIFCEKYSERMRAFDALNYQQMYTLGMLQMKMDSAKGAKPAGMVSKLRRHILSKSEVSDSSAESIKRLHEDLETVYVGQACLSWEALHYQYTKVREMALSESEQELYSPYIADQFQYFQVLLERFLEDEQFEGPRVLNYVKTRCVQRRMLQVPSIAGTMKADTGLLTAGKVLEILEKSILLFWDFIKVDKAKSTGQSQVMNFLCSGPAVEDKDDFALYHSIKRSLHAKEARVQDLQRRGKCLMKKLDPNIRGEGLQILMALVDLKLVSRVLKMPRISSDQLQWCQKKLSKITAKRTRVIRTSSTVLFPY